MNTFRIAVCDDETVDLKQIAETTKNILVSENIDNIISCYKSSKELMKEILSDEKYDLLLLDVLLPEKNGIELASCLREFSYTTPIVFISNDKEMALCGYEVNAVRYLVKPLDAERLREALIYCYEQQKKSKIFISMNNGTYKLMPKEIMYVETSGRGCRISLQDKKLHTSIKISELDTRLREFGFIRCHQGFLVNLCFVRSVKSYELELTDGTKIPISKHRFREVKNTFMSYMEF